MKLLQGEKLGRLALQPPMAIVEQLWDHCWIMLQQQPEQTETAEEHEMAGIETELAAHKISSIAALGRLVAFQVCQTCICKPNCLIRQSPY